MTVNQLQSDALIFLRATGDLAYTKSCPALQKMIKRGTRRPMAGGNQGP
jgi:hypothetical protein